MPKKITIKDLATRLNSTPSLVQESVTKRLGLDKLSPMTKLELDQVEKILVDFSKGEGAKEAREKVLNYLKDEPKSEAVSSAKPQTDQRKKESGHIGIKILGKTTLSGDKPKKSDETALPPVVEAKKEEVKPTPVSAPKVETPVPIKEEKPQPVEPKREEQVAKPASEPKVAPKVEAAPKNEAAPKREVKAETPRVEPTPQPAPAKSVEEVSKSVEKPAPTMVEAPQATEVKPKVDERSYKAEHVGINAPKVGVEFKITNKIDLSNMEIGRPKKKTDKKSKEEAKKRNRIGKEKVDVNAEAQKINKAGADAKKGERKEAKNPQGQSGANPRDRQQQPKGQGAKGANAVDRNKGGKKNAPAKPTQPTEEDIQRQVKENLARLQGKSSISKAADRRKERRDERRKAEEEARERSASEDQTLKLTEFVTVNDLAVMMDVPVTKIIGTCMSLGLMVSINMRLDAETIDLVAEEFGFKTEYVSAEVVEALQVEEDSEDDLETRPAIVTVMGHVDHGKTSLLDYLRNSNVIAGEAGGITQHIGAYSIKLESGKRITFLDTPGHEAFTAMRARGAKVTDIAIIIVAADDDVMPQTKEAINHAAAAGVPIVFAINKIDKPGANPDRIREQLAAMNYLVEEWGGKYQCQEISAKQGLNINDLLEKVLLEAELLDLKANPNRRALGSILESSLDKGRGYVAKVLVQNGTLNTGDVVLAGTHYGKVKAMFNERNQRINSVGPSSPVLILGLDGAPTAGESFNVMETEQEARSIANKREQLKREQDTRTKKGLTLDELARRRAVGNFQELNVIIKGDVDGSIEALGDSLIRLSTEEIQVNVIHKGVGAISESDVVLASASSAIIIGFQVRPSQAARRLAEHEGVEIRTYSIIYDTIEDIKSAMEGMLSPEIKENVVANLEVRETFKITKVGTVAGCVVIEGKIKRNNKIRLIRDGIVKYQGALGSLKRFKDDAKEVVMGQDCGLNIDGYNDIMVGDIIEAYEEIEIKKTLS